MIFNQKDEFQQARLRLTLLYIVMSFIMLSIFSLAAISAENVAFERIQSALSDPVQRPRLTALLELRINTFESNFKRRLFMFDIILLVGASIASYFLSAKTLRPIKEMLEKQQEFAADASHELRTPLTTINMEIEALKRTQKNIPDVYLIFFKSIREEVVRMKHIVDGLLILVRQEKLTDTRLARKRINIVPSVKQAYEQMKPLAIQKKLEYIFISQTENIEILAIEEEIKQLVLILLDNAIKYTSVGKIEISVSIEKMINSVIIGIKDSGKGISESDLPYIFERFYRASSTENTSKGAGLGLSIAQKIVRAYSGKITVRSLTNEGSQFSVLLPLQK